MTRVVVAAIVGCFTARLVWVAVRPLFDAPRLARPNWRGQPVPTAAGVVIPLVVVLVEGGRAVGAAAAYDPDSLTLARLLVVAAVAGFALLGALDDLGGSGDVHGFRAHLEAVAQGRPTTGFVKLVGGAALAVVVVAPLARPSLGRLVADAALVALCANLANLFDRAPGRLLKVATVTFVGIVVAARQRVELEGTALVVGAALALLFDDLRERLMLGDTGANALGAALGLGLVAAATPTTRTVALVAVAVLNVAGELVSFSRVIDAVPALRALDRAGRRP
jgi:UDP-N-acetylmuramyl pentapeptide phosphotransferase/UDP-N-acetylglucosamine-1-phosphate transferase